LIDIIFNFNTAYTDEDFTVIDDRKLISIDYIRSWFSIDVIAILPFEWFVGGSGGSMNDVVRLAKIGRLYKLIKLTKLLRVFKIVKDRSKFLKYVQNML
jgi:potassium voltage-gated channel Eag-related subfamily H protein 8